MKSQRLDACKQAWELKQENRTFAQIAFTMGYVNADGSPKRGKVARMVADYGKRTAIASNVIVDDAPPPKRGLFAIILEKKLDAPKIRMMPLVQADEMIVTGDWHVPTTNWEYLDTLCQFGAKHMRRGKRILALVGDLFNFDGISTYDKTAPAFSMNQELDAAEATFEYVFGVFDTVYFTMGNHDQRFTKLLAGTFGVERLTRLFLKYSESGKFFGTDLRQMETRSGGIHWRLTHQRNYSRNKGIVAAQLCLKYQTNIISHHEHHVGLGRDVFNRYTWINNGMMGDYEKMDYVVGADSTSPVMCNGFTFVRNGTGNLLTPYPSMTDWEIWKMGSQSHLAVMEKAA